MAPAILWRGCRGFGVLGELFGATADGGEADGGRVDVDEGVVFHGVAGVAGGGEGLEAFGEEFGVFLIDGFLEGWDVVFDEVGGVGGALRAAGHALFEAFDEVFELVVGVGPVLVLSGEVEFVVAVVDFAHGA